MVAKSNNNNGDGKPKRFELESDTERDYVLRLRSVIHDPNMWMSGTGPGVQKQTTLSYATQRMMFHTCAVLSGIRNTILYEIERFTRRVRPGETAKAGWRIGLKAGEVKKGGGRNPKKTKITPEDQKRIEEVEKFFEQMYRPGLPKAVEKNLVKGEDYTDRGFTGFVRAIMNDSIEIDALAFEKRRTRDGRLLSVEPIDAATINRYLSRRSLGTGIDERPPVLAEVLDDAVAWLDRRKSDLDDRAAYVQIVDGSPRAYYARDDLALRFRNPRTDILYAAFGYSEVEQLVSIVTALLNAESYNCNNFSNGHIPEGLLHFSGSSYDKGDLESMRRDFEATGMGVANAHRLAILVSRNKEAVAQWITFRMSNRDMEYGSFIKWLVDMAHSVFGISARQTGQGDGFGQPAPLSERNPASEISHSDDKCLHRFLSFLGNVLTEEVVSEFYDDLEFQWVGIDPDDEEFQLQQETQRLQSGTMLPDEGRARRDEDPLPDGLGKVPVNPLLFQVWQQQQQQKQQEQMAGQPPAEGDENWRDYFRAGEPDERADTQEQPSDANTREFEKDHAFALEFARSYALAEYDE